MPDVSGHAASYQIVFFGNNSFVGGTSAVAPLWAALIAQLNELNGNRVGFVNPSLYGHPTAFRDVTTGTNGAYNARAGWDACTGLGSPQGPFDFLLTPYLPVYAQGDPGNGIGGFDLKSAADRAFAFDYDHSGKLDHIVLYRPGTGTIWILKHAGGTFTPVYAQGDPGKGIGGYDLKSPADRLFAFDYEKSGKLDHLVCFRPGTGTLWILKNNGGAFQAVYAEGDPGHGIGGYDLKSPRDDAFAFDFDHTGKADHLCLYRPGTGTCWILRKR